MIKYLGSKRRLVPVLAAMAASAGGRTALDLFSGTARVSMAFKALGLHVTAVDTATYAKVLADTYVAADATEIDHSVLADAIADLQALPPRPGYVTEVFCSKSRYFHPDNGARIDAIRDAIEERYSLSPLHPLLLTSLLEAADRVDSTTGVQMAYLKQWAPRALRPLSLRLPEITDGPGRALLGDACSLAGALGGFDVAYLDPPYNQHRYFGNYHVWETIVRWDAPEDYGVACKRIDCRDAATASAFNRRREMPKALRHVIESVDAGLLLVSYNDESWVSVDDLVEMAAVRGDVGLLAVDQRRYVGAQIGIHSPSGEKVGKVSHVRNTEIVVAAGESLAVARALEAGERAGATAGLNVHIRGPASTQSAPSRSITT